MKAEDVGYFLANVTESSEAHYSNGAATNPGPWNISKGRRF